MEIKDGAKVPSARKLTPAEAEFAAVWRGHYVVAESAEDALALAGIRVSPILFDDYEKGA
jgi:hypothetical protein